ncbi:SDR family NAD(P)-dependent oxidoreductase, partial [Akkermansiaceae bacterium]|nr:SDR family NAD(P)-dependent oxidoreductase [Akkermansiaceae bacterium]
MSDQIHANKVAIVTGAAGGIGRATVERLRNDGATVVGLDINPDVVTNLTGERLTGIVCDITDDAAMKKIIDDTAAKHGSLDLIVAN